MHSTQFTRLAVGALALVAIAAGSNRDGAVRFGSAPGLLSTAVAQESPRVPDPALSPADPSGYHRRRP